MAILGGIIECICCVSMDVARILHKDATENLVKGYEDRSF